jgi:glycosyltransferase 2 family protein
LLNRRRAVPMTAVLASIGLERVFDLLTVLIMLGYLLAAAHGMLPAVLQTAGLIGASITGVAVVGIACVLLWPSFFSAILVAMLRPLPQRWSGWAQRQFNQLLNGLTVVRHPLLLTRIVLLSLLQWATIATTIWSSTRALGVEVTWLGALTVQVLLIVGLTLPTAPAYVGTTQLAFTVGLGLFAIDATPAFSASIIYTLFTVMPMFVLGALALVGRRADLGVAAADSFISPDERLSEEKPVR